MISHKVPENHQDMKFWPNRHSCIGKWKITLFLDDPVDCIDLCERKKIKKKSPLVLPSIAPGTNAVNTPLTLLAMRKVAKFWVIS